LKPPWASWSRLLIVWKAALPLEEALEFERGVQLARPGQARLQQAEQRVQILLADSEDSPLTPFTPDAE
jgi:exodeoxyribonuclease VII small subunit